KFSKAWEDTQHTGHYHSLHDWAVIAEALRGMHFDPEFAKPGELLATAVEDAHRLERIGAKWYQPIPEEDFSELEKDVNELVTKLRVLEYEHAWAVILVVQWYWEHEQDGTNIKNAPWWTLSYRRNWRRQNTEGDFERMNNELRKAREEFRLAQARLDERVLEVKRVEAKSKEAFEAHDDLEQAKAQLMKLKRESKGRDDKKIRAQLEKAQDECERAQKHFDLYGSEMAKYANSNQDLEYAESAFKAAKSRLEDLESKVREKIQAEREKAGEELKQSETRVKELENKFHDLESG